MARLMRVAFIGLALLGAAIVTGSRFGTLDPSPEGFAKFEAHFGKQYATREARLAAYNHFRATTLRALDAQAKNPHATFALNNRSDQPRRQHVSLRFKGSSAQRSTVQADGRLAAAVDWRDRGAVGPVQDQGECGGGCVTFTLASIGESINKINHFTSLGLVPLSSQQLLSCSAPIGWCGCCGCWPETAIEAIVKTNGGIWDTAASYPFKSANGTDAQCEAKAPTSKPGARVLNYVALPVASKEKLMAAIAVAPVGVAVTAATWETYSGGVLSSCGDSGDIDHTVAAVGYDSTANPPYWILKNSWGTEWGEGGYIRISMKGNTCNILNMPFTIHIDRL